MNSGRAGDDDVLVLPPLPADPLFVDAVEDAVAGGSDDLPGAQPNRRIGADPREFAGLYMRHRTSFGLHARRFLYDPRDVEEVLQEAFLRLFLAMPELETEMQALAYCRRTVTNLCIDRYRADQRRPRLVDLDAVEWDPTDEASYDDPVLRAEDAAIVRQALALLTPMHRAALVKREIEEKPLPQIAAELGVPEESVKHLLYRARRALRQLLVGSSVEPGADLSNTQMLRLANERLARATLRSTNVLIVLFVTAVVAVGALRVGANDHEARSGDVGPAGTHTSVDAPTQRAHHPRRERPSGITPSKHTRPPAKRAATPPPAAAPVARPSVPEREESVGHRTPPHVAPQRPTGAPVYSLRGSLRATGPVQVHPVARVIDEVNGTTATTRLSAPTTEGTFTLTQTITQAADDGATTVAILPQLIDHSDVANLGLASAATVTRAPSGTLSVEFTAEDVTGTQPAVGSLDIHMVIASDLLHVLSESVVVGPAGASANSAPETPETASGAAGCGDQPSVTSVGQVITAPTNGAVIGMSPGSSDDPRQGCASSSNGGSFPLLPSPTQP